MNEPEDRTRPSESPPRTTFDRTPASADAIAPKGGLSTSGEEAARLHRPTIRATGTGLISVYPPEDQKTQKDRHHGNNLH